MLANYEFTENLCKVLLDSATKFVANKKNLAIPRLEAYARTLCGLAPWFSKHYDKGSGCIYIHLMKEGTELIKDMLNDKVWHNQVLVEAGYIALAFNRFPYMLEDESEDVVGGIYQKFFERTYSIMPLNNNWVLFPAMVECCLAYNFGQRSIQRMQYAVMQMEQWYKGDGIYGDGDQLQLDYYNSYVIYPMLLAITSYIKRFHPANDLGHQIIYQRAVRYALHLENSISPEGTFPIMGRSSTYRFGAFAHLSAMMLEPFPLLNKGATINALTTVIRRMSVNLVSDKGILQQGLIKPKQIESEWYITRGSSYLCAMGLAHAGLLFAPALWNNEKADWTQKKIWAGKPVTLPLSIKI